MRSYTLFKMACILALLWACDKDSPDGAPENPLQATIREPGDGPFPTLQPIRLDGSLSKDKNGKPFQYLWSLKSQPAGSDAMLTDATKAAASFTPELPGQYGVTLKIFNATHQATDELTVTVTQPDPQPGEQYVVIDEDIDGDRHLEDVIRVPGMPDYVVNRDIRVSGKLTIDPSVTVAFAEFAGMTITEEGSIEASGTAEAPVRLTGLGSEPGSWRGIRIESANEANLLEHTLVEFGGHIFEVGAGRMANVVVGGQTGGRLSLNNTSFRRSGGYGLAVEAGGHLEVAQEVLLSFNEIALFLPPGQAGQLNGFVRLEENVLETVDIPEGVLNSQEISHWSIPAVDGGAASRGFHYRMLGTVEIRSGLALQKGMDIRFERDTELRIAGNGFLQAVGTSQEPIVLQGVQQSASGFWKGLAIGNGHSYNELKYVEIRDAGSLPMAGFTEQAAIALEGSTASRLKLSESLITHSGGHGALVEEGAALFEMGFLRFRDNTGSALVLPPAEVFKLTNAPAMEYTGNGHDGVEIKGLELRHPSGEVTTWPALTHGATYLVRGNLAVHSGLNLSPGLALRFSEGGMLGIFPTGYLIARGTADQPITFTGLQAQNGYWNGIVFRSDSEQNAIEHAVISYAGKQPMPGVEIAASIGLDGDYQARLRVAQTHIAHGMGYGIAVEDPRAQINADVLDANTFEDLALGNVFGATITNRYVK